MKHKTFITQALGGLVVSVALVACSSSDSGGGSGNGNGSGGDTSTGGGDNGSGGSTSSGGSDNGSGGSTSSGGNGMGLGGGGADGSGGDNGGTEPFDYAINGAGFSPHNNQTAGVRVLTMDGTVVACATDQLVSGGAFAYAFEGVLEEGTDYAVEIFAGLGNATGTYQSGDHMWVLKYENVDGDIEEADYAHDGNPQASTGSTVGEDFTWADGEGCAD